MARPRAVFVVPGGLHGITGGNVYDRAVIDALEGRRWAVGVAEPEDAVREADVVVLDSLALRHGPPETDAAVVVLLHQLPSDAERRPEWKEAESAVLASAHLVITVSEGVAVAARRSAQVDPVVIPPGWDGAAAARRGPHPDLVLVVANAHPGKGVPDAVTAYGRAGPVASSLVVVGDVARDPEEHRRVQAAVAACRRPVVLAGVLPPQELPRLYARAAVFLTASRYEGWPIAVAEAMASGAPVVGFDAPGVRDLVRDGRDGALAPAGDVDVLARALAGVASDPDRSRALGLAARRRARAWPTWAHTGRRFAEELKQVLLRPPARRTPRTPTPIRTP